MKRLTLTGLLFFISIGLFGCYTILSHPVVKNENSYSRVKFYNDCLSCHSNSELVDFGYYHLEQYPSQAPIGTLPLYITPTDVPPWWSDIRIPVVQENNTPRNDDTRLRNYDGGRTSAPSDFSIPSRNSGSSSGSSASSNASNGNTTNSSNDRNSRERDSDTPKSRNNSGERKK
ncbi:MAG: hypothetical protein ACPL25_02035 [Ignavibacteria bacterium]